MKKGQPYFKEELKACPFCGNHDYGLMVCKGKVKCSQCQCEVPLESWNHRKPKNPEMGKAEKNTELEGDKMRDEIIKQLETSSEICYLTSRLFQIDINM